MAARLVLTKFFLQDHQLLRSVGRPSRLYKSAMRHDMRCNRIFFTEDPDFHAASVKQTAAYNARPEVLARAAEWRNGDGYVGRIASDAVR